MTEGQRSKEWTCRRQMFYRRFSFLQPQCPYTCRRKQNNPCDHICCCLQSFKWCQCAPGSYMGVSGSSSKEKCPTYHLTSQNHPRTHMVVSGHEISGRKIRSQLLFYLCLGFAWNIDYLWTTTYKNNSECVAYLDDFLQDSWSMSGKWLPPGRCFSSFEWCIGRQVLIK